MTPFRPNPLPLPMPKDLKIALFGITPDQAAALLVQVQQAYIQQAMGQAPASVDTPQLGRVTFAGTTLADMQRLINYLNSIVAGGGDGTGGTTNVRRPFSFYGWP